MIENRECSKVLTGCSQRGREHFASAFQFSLTCYSTSASNENMGQIARMCSKAKVLESARIHFYYYYFLIQENYKIF